MRYLFTVLLFCVPVICSADIYKQVDQNGNVTYSDTPLGNNSVKIAAPDVNTVPSTTTQPALPPSTTPPAAPENMAVTKSANKPYTVFMISSPSNQETIQNQPFITVHIKIDPPLQEGDSIEIYLDGNPWGKPQTTTQISFITPERGTHEISAKLFDRNMQVLKVAPANTIYIHQAHLGS
jgi:hypothetical protein